MDVENIELLSEREKKIARRLLEDKAITEAQFGEFLANRARMDAGGKTHLGDMLIKEGHITKDALDEFFQTNNRIYLDLLGKLTEGGFLSESQYEAVMREEASKTNVVAALEKLKIMTRDSFIRHCSNRAHLIMLGEWLIMKGKIQPQVLERTLEEQHVNNLEDYLVHRKLVGKDRIGRLIDEMRLH
jgi:hypothetical protein